MNRVRWCFALLATVGVVIAAGCGGAETTVSAEPLTPEQLSQAVSASVESQSSRFALDFSTSFSGAGTFEFSGEGAFHPGNERATMSLDLSSLAGLLGGLMGGLQGLTPTPGQGAPDFSDPEQWKIDAILDGDIAYLRFPALAGRLPEGKSWVRIDSSDAGKDLGVGDLATDDPRELLEMLDAVSGDIEAVGTEELRGTLTTHYRAMVDVADLDRFTPENGDQELGSVIDEALERAGFSEIPFDIWLDDEGLIRKIQASMSVAPPDENEELDASLSFELYDYGVDVDVTPPPADEVVDASTLTD